MPSAISTRSLLDRIRSGDDEALAALVNRFWSFIVAAVCRCVGSHADPTVSEAASETKLRLFRELKKGRDIYRSPGAFRMWIRTIARSAFVDLTRLAGRQARFDDLVEIADPVRTDSGLGIDLAEAIETLTPCERSEFDRRMSGESGPEKAGALCQEASTLRRRWFRATRRLRRFLGGPGEGWMEE